MNADNMINTFLTIEDAQTFLDGQALNLYKTGDLVQFWLAYKNKNGVTDVEKQQSQWEVESFLFDFKGSRAFSLVYSYNDQEITKYPDLNQATTQGYDYLKTRAQTAKSTLLLAKYNHLLWRSPVTKNRVYAISAINNYIETIKEYCRLLENEASKEICYQIGRLYENLAAVSNEIRYTDNKLKSLTSDLLYTTKNMTFYTRHGVITDMLEYNKVFKPADFANIFSIYENQIKSNDEEIDELFWISHYLPTAVRVAQTSGKDPKRWHNEIGEANLLMASTETEEDRNWLKLDRYHKAIKAFVMAGNADRREYAEKLYSKLRPSIKLESYQYEHDEATQKQLNDHLEYLKNEAQKLLTQAPDEIYTMISLGRFFPSYSLTNDAAKPSKENAFLNFVTAIRFDNNKNISNLKDDEDFNPHLFETYMWLLHDTAIPFLRHVFVYGIKSGHLTPKNLIGFLKNRTWIGIPRQSTDLGGDLKINHWTKLLLPGITEFFNQFLAWGESKYYQPNFILCTDSLTLKIEGLIRDFCNRLQITTSAYKPKGMQEILLPELLEKPEFKKHFDKDDQLLFEYVLSSKPGAINLRNNIAHGFYNEDDYYPDQASLIIAILLRLSKYNFPKKP